MIPAFEIPALQTRVLKTISNQIGKNNTVSIMLYQAKQLKLNVQTCMSVINTAESGH